MIEFSIDGGFENTINYLTKLSSGEIFKSLSKYGREGVQALSTATPRDSGLTASSWDFTVDGSGGKWTITWTNSNVNDGVPIAIILQYGHGTGTGGYVQGQDYINPAIKPVFDRISREVWKEVTSA